MAETKEGALTEADLAVYGIPPKQPERIEAGTQENIGPLTNDPDAELSDEGVEKASKA